MFRKSEPEVGILRIFGGQASAELTTDICRYLGVEVGAAEIFKFSNDNTFVRSPVHRAAACRSERRINEGKSISQLFT